jgi:adenylate cyclase
MIPTSASEQKNEMLLLLNRQNKVILVMDLVESVRIMAEDEVGTVTGWQAFLEHANTVVIPAAKGQLIKETGDGFVAIFGSSLDAVRCALSLQRFFDRINIRRTTSQTLQLRAGLHATYFYRGPGDIYGNGVNIAARITALAMPGETVITADVRDDITDGLDYQIEDMGESFLKHVQDPVRTFRISPRNSSLIRPNIRSQLPIVQPRIAVIPFETRRASPENFDLGDLISDGVIARLGRSTSLRVIAKLSTMRLRGYSNVGGTSRELLESDYTLTGSFLVIGSGKNESLLVTATLISSKTQEILWSERLKTKLLDLFELNSELCMQIADGAQGAILKTASDKAMQRPMPTIESYSLLLSGICLMHRSTTDDMNLSRKLLGHLTERHPTAGDAYAWLAKSYILNAVSSFKHSTEDSRRALSICKAGLLRNSESALSLAVQAHLNTHLDAKPDRALNQIGVAIGLNPSEPLAWLFKSVLSAMWGDPSEAVNEANRAQLLSPIDPLNYYFKMIAASAYAANQDYEKATELAVESIRLNRLHTPTWRVLISAFALGGNSPKAKAAFLELLKLDAEFSIDDYLRAGNAESRTKQQFVSALREIGI